MKRFEFRLQRTMDWRQLQSDTEKAALERMHGKRQELSDSRNEVGSQLQELVNGQSRGEGFRAEELHQQAMFTLSLFNLDRRLASDETRCEQDIRQQTQKCVEADRSHKLLDKLRTDGQRKWAVEFDRELEQTAADNWTSVNRRTAHSEES